MSLGLLRLGLWFRVFGFSVIWVEACWSIGVQGLGRSGFMAFTVEVAFV